MFVAQILKRIMKFEKKKKKVISCLCGFGLWVAPRKIINIT